MVSSTREQLLAATGRLLQRRGYHGTSLNDILQESGAPRGSLYFHFPGGKSQLAEEATRAELAEATQLLASALDEHRDPADGVRAAFAAIAEYLEQSDYALGCPIAPLTLETAPGLADLTREGFAEWHELLQRAFLRAGVEKRRAGGLATLVIAAEEGAILLARAQHDAAPLHDAAEELARTIRAAMPAKPPRRKRAGR